MPHCIGRFTSLWRLIEAKNSHALLIKRLRFVEVDYAEFYFSLLCKVGNYLKVEPYSTLERGILHYVCPLVLTSFYRTRSYSVSLTFAAKARFPDSNTESNCRLGSYTGLSLSPVFGVMYSESL